MVKQIPELPSGVVGFEARDTVTASDYETVIVPAVKEMFAHQSKGRFLYHLGPDFSGFEAGAMWDDAKLGLKHVSGWERVAVVSDVDWIRSAMKVFGVVIPGHVRVFHDRELDDAKRWVAE